MLIRMDRDKWVNLDHIVWINDNPVTQQTTIVLVNGNNVLLQGRNRANFLTIVQNSAIQGTFRYNPG